MAFSCLGYFLVGVLVGVFFGWSIFWLLQGLEHNTCSPTGFRVSHDVWLHKLLSEQNIKHSGKGAFQNFTEAFIILCFSVT